MSVIINYNAPIEMQLNNKTIILQGGGLLSTIEDDELKELLKDNDFKLWIDTGTIVVNPQSIENAKNDNIEKKTKKAKKENLQAEVDGLALTYMQVDEMTKEQAYEEAKKQINLEAEKAKQAGDADLFELEEKQELIK